MKELFATMGRALPSRAAFLDRIDGRFRWTAVALDLSMFALALVAAFLIRFDLVVPSWQIDRMLAALPVILAVKLIAFFLGGLYRGRWRSIGIVDVKRLVLVNVAAAAACTALIYALIGPGFPRSVYILDCSLCILATAGMRCLVRISHEEGERRQSRRHGRGVLIYGAGRAGTGLLREIWSDLSLGYDVLGFIDDDPHKARSRILGVPVLGSGRELEKVVRNLGRRKAVREILVAMPTASEASRKAVFERCQIPGVSCKAVPGMSDLLRNRELTAQLRPIALTDLLGRPVVELPPDSLGWVGMLQDSTVLVSGAAGSIGSELCRQILLARPRRLILLDQAESDLFKIDMELRESRTDTEIIPRVVDIRDVKQLRPVFASFPVAFVFHAAAYKHVPLMEAHVAQAVSNNIFGTRNLVQAASRYGVKNFVMISSDKAVNPTNVMGATKRIAELVVSAMGGQGLKTNSVRFGNVLGSNGSVVPVFQKQIAKGGPVMVTHPDIRRYFMTIPEAVQLVLQASTLGEGAEIFVLDMGEQVKIVDLATRMIQLAGYEVGVDIEIRFTGLRPGEKLFEELMLRGENIRPTLQEKIKVFQGRCPDERELREWLAIAERLVDDWDDAALVAHMKNLLPEYQPGAEWSGRLSLAASA